MILHLKNRTSGTVVLNGIELRPSGVRRLDTYGSYMEIRGVVPRIIELVNKRKVALVDEHGNVVMTGKSILEDKFLGW